MRARRRRSYSNKKSSPRKRFLVRGTLLLLIGSFLSCSPGYVLRAGWEEAGILLRREPIQDLLGDQEVDEETKRKFRLVLDARSFAEEIGLEPKGSFSKYTQINREVLVWVLTGSEKTALNPVTWWFPIVGSIPYKGFFEKEDGLAAAEKLRTKGYDIYLRPSPAFSTLGWFDDPLLSTTLKYEDIDLANTVIHEILHNTIWVPNQVPFNESLANFVGSRGVAEYFAKRFGTDNPLALEAENSWHDQLIYARFLDKIIQDLKSIYDDGKKRSENVSEEEKKKILAEVLEKREQIFTSAKTEWQNVVPTLKTKRFVGAIEKLNNAVILAQQTYFQTPWVFEDLYRACGRSMTDTLVKLKELEKAPKFKEEPFRIIEEKVKLLQKEGQQLFDNQV